MFSIISGKKLSISVKGEKILVQLISRIKS